MRTDTQVKLKSETSTSEHSTSDSKETMTIVRKSLHPLQVAAGDKENLVGAGRMPPTISEKDSKILAPSSKHSNTTDSVKKEKKKSNKNLEKKIITEEDLTSEEGPSAHYWEVLAERRRKALESALKENQQLHERLHKMSEENQKYKELLDEAQAIIDTLNEVIAEMDNEDGSRDEDEVVRRA